MSVPVPNERDLEMARELLPWPGLWENYLPRLAAGLAAARDEGRREERERCARVVESQVRLRGGAEWGLDIDRNDTLRLLASMIRSAE